MRYGYYRNIPHETSIKVKSIDLEPVIMAEFERVKSNQQILVDLNQYEFNIGNRSFPIAASEERSIPGEYEVVEKWEYPYWRRTDGVYTPADDNPIGKYLIILKDLSSGRKVNSGFHSFAKLPNSVDSFCQGAQTEGCITFKPEDMESVFHMVELGAKIVYIKDSMLNIKVG